MPTTRSTITAGAATLVAGAALTFAALTGDAGASTPSPSTDPTPAGVVLTRTVPCGATSLAIDPDTARPTATIMASAAPTAQQGPGSDDTDAVSGGVCADTDASQPGAAADATASALPTVAVAGN